MLRPSADDNSIRIQGFYVLIQSPIDFDVEDIQCAVRYGLQDAMQDEDLQADVQINVGELPVTPIAPTNLSAAEGNNSPIN